uniref:mohawk homeobox a isoform X1 n=2 Tax=Doryrhamphus excisus TaxID=161450 RepID=UPI0025AE38FF|nr:mohawk homeobox a isoform X1 [Doryrhamphus excisus]XP_057916635.1 mohawk homeobox a isoform X1 [Doryrhamphus excisus]XP_057916637.1 mohawk homeobox a isoform X1 [Doryrhamphus excisus]XP_057916638.1 mohawk homeobox a isoform X1 [Doryrhamphus excisus]XP_057916639.1 mohawk homeobox a isoform X1 [Doryrhamphus excisus]
MFAGSACVRGNMSTAAYSESRVERCRSPHKAEQEPEVREFGPGTSGGEHMSGAWARGHWITALHRGLTQGEADTGESGAHCDAPVGTLSLLRHSGTIWPKMNTIVFNKLGGQVLFEEKANEVEMSSRNYLEVMDGQHPDLLSGNQAIRDNQAVRHRRNGGRPGGSKVRHKRQALQDMARPLKQWLYKHRDNPYPTKTEKILLALGSQMTLVQVSNWFANARRRLKNTVRQPDLSWALRIKLYNKYVQGNAERLSVSSDDSCSDDGDNPQRSQSGPGELTKPMYQSVIKKEGSAMMAMGAGLRSAADASSLADDYVSPPKYKSSLLHRYLNDSLRHVMVANAVMDARKRNHSGSFSSNEYDDELLSPTSSEAEANFVYRTETTDHGSSRCDNVGAAPREKAKGKDETYWKEINAAMALTNLAQGKDGGAGTTSCIIQKSSHIAEIKTVKVPLGPKF